MRAMDVLAHARSTTISPSHAAAAVGADADTPAPSARSRRRADDERELRKVEGSPMRLATERATASTS